MKYSTDFRVFVEHEHNESPCSVTILYYITTVILLNQGDFSLVN